MPDWLIDGSAWVLPVILAITLHEAAHGWMAEKFGDDTARRLGRVTFNPIRHIDRFGTIIFPALLLLMRSPVVFGSAKPVPVDFRRLQPPRLGMMMVALAGPGTNVILAIISALLLHALDAATTPEASPWLYQNLYDSIMINCALAVFNMFPILPLDGGRVVASLLTGRVRQAYDKLERFGIPLLMLALLVPALLGVPVLQQLLGPPVVWLGEHVLILTGNGTQ